MQKYRRRDWFFGPLHLIKRGYREPQYGFLIWRDPAERTPTLDVWVRRTLLTLRRSSP